MTVSPVTFDLFLLSCAVVGILILYFFSKISFVNLECDKLKRMLRVNDDYYARETQYLFAAIVKQATLRDNGLPHADLLTYRIVNDLYDRPALMACNYPVGFSPDDNGGVSYFWLRNIDELTDEELTYLFAAGIL